MEDKVFERANTEKRYSAKEFGSFVLASKTDRFFAVLIDSVIGAIWAIPFWMYTGMWEMLRNHQKASLTLTMASATYGFIFFVIVHGYFLKQQGQTIGKKMIGIRIADMNGDIPSINTLIFKRYLPITVIPVIPIFGGIFSIVDIGMIFKKDRRCLHDLIAGTQVLKI